MKQLILSETVESKILLIRGHKVLLDRDLARLYGVTTKALKQAVKRNAERFPSDFMFQLNKRELEEWRSQFVTSNSSDKMGLRYSPYAFTQEGVAMLSSVLKSNRAIQVNIQIMRIFAGLRRTLLTHGKLATKLSELERKIERHDTEIRAIFDAIRELMKPSDKSKRKIGFSKD